jgi:WYL domain
VDPTPLFPEETPAAAPLEARSRWGQERRLEFIDFRLRWDAQLNRSDLTSHFGISVPQASLDIARYQALAPGNLGYDRKARVYVAEAGFEPLFPARTAERYLDELLSLASASIDPDASFIGWCPAADTVPAPSRHMNAGKLITLLRSIRERRRLSIDYQSMTRPELAVREVSPHAFAHDGLRWHLRAFCHTRQQFLNFALARVLRTEIVKESDVESANDGAWHNVLQVTLAPQPNLAPAHRRAVELDYDMRNGSATLPCREALLPYALRRLGFGAAGEGLLVHPQVVVTNSAEIAPYLVDRQKIFPEGV